MSRRQNVYTVDFSCTAIVEADSEEEAKVKTLTKDWRVNMVDYYGMKATLQLEAIQDEEGEPVPHWRGNMKGLEPYQGKVEE